LAEYRITYWKDIPSQVEAFDGPVRVRRLLTARFQELIDTVAMRQALAGTEGYLQAWRAGPAFSREGSPGEVADAVAAEIEAQFEALRDTVL
jgi:hypothetical protein